MVRVERRARVLNTARAVALRPATVPGTIAGTFKVGDVPGYLDLVGSLSAPDAVSHEVPAEAHTVRLDAQWAGLVGTP